MKRYILYLIPFVLLLLVGCANDYITFSGEGESWKGDYSANIDGTKEDGSYNLNYKNGDSNTNFKNLEVVINDGETSWNVDSYEGRTIKIQSSCTECFVTREDKVLKVTIKWDDENEEIFFLEQNKK